MKFGTRILVYTITLMLTSCVSKKDAYSVSNHDMSYGSLQLLCRDGDGKILGSQDLLIGGHKKNICLERSGDKVFLERKLRVNPYSKNLTRLSFVCEEKSLVEFLSLNSNREVAIVFDDKVIATAMTGRPGGVGCEFGGFSRLEDAINMCVGVSKKIEMPLEGCYQPCRSNDDIVCVNQGAITF